MMIQYFEVLIKVFFKITFSKYKKDNLINIIFYNLNNKF